SPLLMSQRVAAPPGGRRAIGVSRWAPPGAASLPPTTRPSSPVASCPSDTSCVGLLTATARTPAVKLLLRPTPGTSQARCLYDEHAGAREGSALESVQGLVGALEGKGGRGQAYGNARRLFQQPIAVGSRVGGHRPDGALEEQVPVVEG